MPQGAEGAALAAVKLTGESRLFAIVGPTASGKTALSLELARRLGGEIVSADSRQVYRKLDAGTAKPDGAWEQGHYMVDGVGYHLVDVVDPVEQITAGRFAELARERFAEIRSRGRVPILAGGTGLYVRAALGGLDRLPRRDEAVRARLAEQAELRGRAWLHAELERVDPEAARRIPPNNLQRVVRALEVRELTGRPISSFWSRPGGEPALFVGIAWSKAELDERIRARCEEMFPKIVAEVRRLVPAEYRGDEPGFQSLGYAEALQCLRGDLLADEAQRRFIRATQQYAKRQATWFRNQAPVRWLASAAGDVKVWAAEAEDLWNASS